MDLDAVTVVQVDASYIPECLKMFDRTIAWLASQGRTGQWGSEARSTQEAFIQRVTGTFDTCSVYRAVWKKDIHDTTASSLGFICFAPERAQPAIIPPAPEPEIFIHMLITDQLDPKRPAGVGRLLVEQAKVEARRGGARLVRVECYGGGDQRLVSVYERMGFARNPVEPIKRNLPNEKDWPMQVLEMWLDEQTSST